MTLKRFNGLNHPCKAAISAHFMSIYNEVICSEHQLNLPQIRAQWRIKVSARKTKCSWIIKQRVKPSHLLSYSEVDGLSDNPCNFFQNCQSDNHGWLFCSDWSGVQRLKRSQDFNFALIFIPMYEECTVIPICTISVLHLDAECFVSECGSVQSS